MVESIHFTMGYHAFHSVEGNGENPYDKRFHAGQEWDRGWKLARDEWVKYLETAFCDKV